MSDLSNSKIAEAFDELGDLYELDGAIVHRVLAYRNAAQAVRDASVSVAALARQGRATEISGVGKTLEDKIGLLLDTGEIPSAAKLRAKYPSGLIDVMRLPGFGAKRARRLYDELGVDSLDALRAAVEAEQVRTLKGFGPKVEEKLGELLAAEEPARRAPRVVLSRALSIANELVQALREHPAADRVELAGSARRGTDSVKDLDIIATAADPDALAAALSEHELIESVQASGDAGSRMRTHTGMSVDLRIVEPDQFGNLLQHFTGSKAHNVQLREAAVKKGLHVSEYGVLDDESGETLRCASEADVYARLGLAYIEPELREGRGELAAAGNGGKGLPDLIELGDLRGDLHCHTVASDGRATIEQMAEAAEARGYEYLAITDHSASHGFGNHVSPDDLRRQIERVHEVSESMEGITLLAGSEVNIGLKGEPDYDDDLLAALDWVIASVHTSFGIGEKGMTDRVVTAIEHPLIDAIGHPTGRKIEKRPPYPLDLERVIEAAARTGTMIEINSAPDRRDLNDLHARAAAEAGVTILIDSDAHSVRNLDLIRYGITTARRAWLTADNVANTRSWKDFAPLRKRAKR